VAAPLQEAGLRIALHLSVQLSASTLKVKSS